MSSHGTQLSPGDSFFSEQQLNRAESEEEDGGTKVVETKPAEPNRSPRSSVTAASTATTTITTQAQQQQQQLWRKARFCLKKSGF